MFPIIRSHIIIGAICESKHAKGFFIMLIIAPQISIYTKQDIPGIFAFLRLDLLCIRNPQQDPFSRKILLFPVKHFIGITVIIHQVNSLIIPLHSEIIFCPHQGTITCAVCDPHIIFYLDLPHDPIVQLQCDLRFSLQLCFQSVPGKMIKTCLDTYIA